MKMGVPVGLQLPLLALGISIVGEIVSTSFIPLLTGCLYANGHRSDIYGRARGGVHFIFIGSLHPFGPPSPGLSEFDRWQVYFPLLIPVISCETDIAFLCDLDLVTIANATASGSLAQARKIYA